MYNGTNPSALRSQQWFSEALFSLMQTKSFSKITIKELCTQADLTRQTFYQLFSSKEDVLRLVLMKYYTAFEQSLLSKEQLDLRALTEVFFHFFKLHKEFVQQLIDHNLDYLLTEQFTMVLPRIMQLCIDDDIGMIENPHINCFIVSGLSAMIIDWLKNDSSTDEKELVRLFLQMFQQ